MSVCAPLILTVSPDCVTLQNTLDPCSGYGCYGGAWKKKASNNFFSWQIRFYLIKSFPNKLQFSKSPSKVFKKTNKTRASKWKTSLTGQRGQRGWWRHSLECVWSGWGPASWPEGTATSRVPPLGFLLRSCRPTTGASESRLLWRPKPEPQTAG